MIKVWDRTNRSLLKDLTGHAGAINNLAWVSNPDRLVSAGIDGTIRIWDWERSTNELISNAATGQAFAIDLPRGLVAAKSKRSKAGELEIRSIVSPYSVTAKFPLEGEIASLGFSGDGRTMAVRSIGVIAWINLSTGVAKVIYDLTPNSIKTARAIFFRKDSRFLISVWENNAVTCFFRRTIS